MVARHVCQHGCPSLPIVCMDFAENCHPCFIILTFVAESCPPLSIVVADFAELETIPEETAEDGSMIDIGNDSSDEDEEGPVKKKQATEGGEEGVSTPPLIDLVGHCDDGFYLTKKVMASALLKL